MTTNTLKRPLATFTVLCGLLIAAAPAGAKENTVPSGGGEATIADSTLGSSRSGTANNIKAVVVLIGANEYGFADIDPRRHPQTSPG